MDSRPADNSNSISYGGPIGFIVWPLVLCFDIILTLIHPTITLSWFWGFIFKAALLIGLLFFIKNTYETSSRNRMDKTRKDLSRAQSELQSVDMALQGIVAQIATLRSSFENNMRQLV